MNYKRLKTPKNQLRPCEANDRPAIFHCWIGEDRALLKINTFLTDSECRALSDQFKKDYIVKPGTSAEVIRNTYALVEYPDGSMDKVKPELITFMDRRER